MELQNKTLGEIVTADYRASRVFQKYDIDFCCGGSQNFMDACKGAGVEPTLVASDLQAIAKEESEINYDGLNLSELIQFILEEHHEYVRSESQLLINLANKVYEVHGDHHPELAEIAATVMTIMADMDQHQMKEEQILFPYIEAMMQATHLQTALPETCFGDVTNPIRAMENDHDEVGSLLFKLKELTNNYEVPADGCQSYSILYKRLEAFQNNTFRHVHLENNILFRKSVLMQDALR